MYTKIPFARRTIVLAGFMTLAASAAFLELVDLQIANAASPQSSAKQTNSQDSSIPGQRGRIMDRNEEMLTNNIQSAKLLADRNKLRDINVVVQSLAYNHASNDPRWDTLETEKERNTLVENYKAKLLRNAKADLTEEEKAELQNRSNTMDATANRLSQYDAQILEHYYQQHDKLVAEVLYPFLSHQEIEEKVNSQTIKRFMTREDIVEKIAQTATLKHNEEAQAKGEPTRSLRISIPLAKDIDFDTAEKIEAAISNAHINGLEVKFETGRSYVMPEMLCHVLGYVNKANQGQSGIERQFNSYLQDKPGFRQYRRSPSGKVLAEEYSPPQSGISVKLTIDMRLQAIVEQELDKGMRHFRAKNGCMIVVEPKTGNILAMVSRPAHDLNDKEDIITHNGKVKKGTLKDDKGNVITGEFNFACQARYEPGSTFKVVAVTSVVDKGLMRITDYVNCEPFSVGLDSRPISDRPFNYHSLPVWGVLKKSSNPGAARLAIVAKWPNYKEYLQKFGLTESVGVDLPSGGGCIVTDGTNIVNFSRIAYGYSVNVSPLHIAMMYATIANDGVRMKPRIVEKLIAADGSEYMDCAPKEICRVMKSSTAKDLLFGLESVTQRSGECGRGTATAAAIPGFRIGGKTGTAKKVKAGGGYADNLYTVSFAGVLPVDDPKLVVLTVIDEPHPTDCNPGGGTVAAPIFRAAAERFINVLNLTPSDPEAYEKYLATKEESANLKK